MRAIKVFRPEGQSRACSLLLHTVMGGLAKRVSDCSDMCCRASGLLLACQVHIYSIGILHTAINCFSFNQFVQAGLWRIPLNINAVLHGLTKWAFQNNV